jgi:hypothetical protein
MVLRDHRPVPTQAFNQGQNRINSLATDCGFSASHKEKEKLALNSCYVDYLLRRSTVLRLILEMEYLLRLKVTYCIFVSGSCGESLRDLYLAMRPEQLDYG